MSLSLPVLAIVGRPNVGKSTFFNRLVKRRAAIVDDTPGVTRDRNYSIAKYGRFEFLLIDTGGFEPESKGIKHLMRQQSQLAVEEADAVIFMLDVREGWTADDEEIYRYLVKSEKNIYFVVNKTDSEKQRQEVYEFYQSGRETIYSISAQHNLGIDDLLEEINQSFPLAPQEQQMDSSAAIKVAVVGQPNVGKSSLINSILQENRMVVDETAGTTRDSVDSLFTYKGQNFSLIDTAGIRRKTKVSQKIETFSIVSSLRSIERSDVVLLVIDGTQSITTQAAKIAGYISDRKRAVVIVVNKWDLAKGRLSNQKEKKLDIYERLAFIDYASIVFVSAKTGKNVSKIFDLVNESYHQFTRRIQTSDLNTILEQIVAKHSPPVKSGRPTRIYYGNQVVSSPPTFVFMTNNPDKTNSSYERYMINQLRYHFGFRGTPLEIIWRKRVSKYSKQTH
ncbi:MAG: ribosome biogenesis GTPase Der [SAR324 cluster bacterium]|nr:ribosome biogenesis GTPase Der [SAR324 cluster bacterium]